MTKVKLKRIEEYNKSPKQCARCAKIIEYERRADAHCSLKCGRRSARAIAHAKAIAQNGGYASGRKRAVTDEDFALNQHLSGYKTSAKNRGLCFDLTRDQFKVLVESDCWFCGASPAPTWKHSKLKAPPRFNGVDRLDNEKGYTVGNSVSCCGPCNRAKHTMGLQEFIDRAVRITKRHGTNSPAQCFLRTAKGGVVAESDDALGAK
jgi:hypothetical protein